MAVINVEDTGVGIPEKNFGMIFDPFFTTKEVGVGTGLGLSIVYGILQQHHGSISVESKVGEGTRFIIRLPLHQRT
jgi:signal transduction histidine kinase